MKAFNKKRKPKHSWEKKYRYVAGKYIFSKCGNFILKSMTDNRVKERQKVLIAGGIGFSYSTLISTFDRLYRLEGKDVGNDNSNMYLPIYDDGSYSNINRDKKQDKRRHNGNTGKSKRKSKVTGK